MIIEYINTIPERNEYFELFMSTGWNDKYQKKPQELHDSIKNSFYLISAYHENRLIGFGRVIADGIMHALIVDMIIYPEYQGKGVGKEILERLIQKCKDNNIPDIQLFSAKGKAGFYVKYGFMPRDEDSPGMQFYGVNKDYLP